MKGTLILIDGNADAKLQKFLAEIDDVSMQFVVHDVDNKPHLAIFGQKWEEK